MKTKSESIAPAPVVTQASSGTPHADVIGRTPSVPDAAPSDAEVTRRPVEGQEQEADGIAKELADVAQYRAVFGVYAPDPAGLAAAMRRAKALGDEAARAKAWAAYVGGLSDAAWDDALARMEELKEPYGLASSKNAAVQTRYPHVSAFYDARSNIAMRAAVSRRRNRDKQPK